MMAMSAEPKAGAARLLSLTGVGAVALVVASFAGLGGDTPGASDSAATISAYYDGHEVREMLAAFVLAASAPLFVIFGVTLALSLWQAEARRRPLWQSTLALGSAVAGVGFLIAALFHIALTQTANASGVSTGALQSLAALDEHSWVAFNSGLGVMMLGAAGTLLATRAHPVLGWIALATGIALFVPFADFVGLIVSGLWIITTSVQLYRSQPADSLARRPELA
jgi:hypothetical protein